MKTAIETMIKSRRTGLARPRQRGSVAARVGPAMFPRTVTIVRRSGCLFQARWLFSAVRTQVSAEQFFPSPEFRPTINTHRAGVVPAV